MCKLFEIPSRTNHIQRFSGKHIQAHRSSIAEHSFEVAYYTAMIMNSAIADNPLCIALQSVKAYALEYALVHDVPEIVTGDAPYTVKARFPELKEALNKVEEVVFPELVPSFNTSPDECIKFVVKLADAIAVTREIVTEIKYGNASFGDKEIQNCRDIFNTTFKKYYDCVHYESIVKAFHKVVEDSPIDNILKG